VEGARPLCPLTTVQRLTKYIDQASLSFFFLRLSSTIGSIDYLETTSIHSFINHGSYKNGQMPLRRGYVRVR
jgi:hypothetical protein